MKTGFSHPLWIHLPSVIALCMFLWVLANSGPLPASAPIHFGVDGAADHFGSPWPGLLAIAASCVLVIGIAVSSAERRVRQETKKSFNLWSLFDDLFVGSMAGIGIAYVMAITSGEDTFGFPWQTMLLIAGATTVIAAVLEFIRPFRPFEGHIETPVHADKGVLATEVREKLTGEGTVAYYETQNPLLSRALSTIVPIFITGQALVDYTQSGKLEFVPFIVAMVIVVLLFGGMRTMVTRNEVAVRFGTPGIRVLRIDMADIEDVRLRPFFPLGDFHGYGIRYNGQMKGVFLRGGVGVEITTRQGKHYLIGSDNPDKLAAVITVILEGKTSPREAPSGKQ